MMFPRNDMPSEIQADRDTVRTLLGLSAENSSSGSSSARGRVATI
jgi:hypothetical protein